MEVNGHIKIIPRGFRILPTCKQGPEPIDLPKSIISVSYIFSNLSSTKSYTHSASSAIYLQLGLISYFVSLKLPSSVSSFTLL